MKFDFEVIRVTKNFVVYKLDNIYQITEQFLENLPFKLSEKKAMIIFNKEVDNEFFLNNLSSKYITKISYSIHKEKLIDRPLLFPKNIKSFEFSDKIEFQKYYVKQFEDYCKTWKDLLTKEYIKILLPAANELIDDTKYICLKKDDLIVSFISLIKWHDYIGEEIDLIAHIWIDNLLNKEERFWVHNYFLLWLKNNMNTDKLWAAVHLFNIRSCKFFRKRGFKVKCITIEYR